MSRLFAILLLLVSIGQPATDTQKTVRVDVIVTDKQGKPLTDLRPTDFTILENGVAQKVGDVRLKTLPLVGPLDTPPAIASAEDEERAAGEPGTRIIALYLDEYHVSPGPNTDRVRQAVTRFIDEQVRPQDLVLVMKPLDPVTSVRFTRDRDAARRAAESFSGRNGAYEPRTPFEEQYLGRSPEAIRTARAQIVMSGLRAVTTRISELDGGLAAVVLVSEGFNADVPRSRERRLPDLQGLVRASSRARVLLYAFDPASIPPVAPAPPTDDDDANSAPNAISTLQNVAQQTGGQSVNAGQDLTPALQRVSRDLDTYYVVSFVSSNPSDGRFRSIQVTSRKDAQVRTRTGYWAPLPETRLTRTMLTPALLTMRAVRRSPLIDSWLGMTMEPDGRTKMMFTWTPTVGLTPKRLAPISRPDVVMLKVTTPAGAVLFDGEVRAARGPGMSSQGSDLAAFLTDPGRLQFDLTILQADGTKLDVGSQDFDVPQKRPGKPQILPAQLFRAASAREVREITADANAAPLPGREFRRTETLLLRVPTYDPAGANVTVSARLINRIGSTVSEFTPVPLSSGAALSQFNLSLARFAPGEYSIEIAAQSTSGISRELIRVRITG